MARWEGGGKGSFTVKTKGHKKTIVAMSGGVDSSVAAALLKREGHDLLGVTFEMFDEGGEDRGCRPAEYAGRAAEFIGIPHKTVRINDLFKKRVVSYFIEEYLKGRTPVPCAVCNKLVKFHELISLAEVEGFSFIATGHYARAVKTGGSYLLKKGVDTKRDQSFFLSRLGQDELKRAVFPLGDLKKNEVREIASEMNLPTIPGESREICFVSNVGNKSYRDFIEREVAKSGVDGGGEIVDVSGRVLGGHDGYYHFTVGQRRGIGIPSEEPYYVVGIDADKKRVVVGKRDSMYKRVVEATDFSWVSGARPVEDKIRVSGMIRYNQSPGFGTATIEGNDRVTVKFDEPQFAPAPGQTLVLFNDDTLLGGGFIL